MEALNSNPSGELDASGPFITVVSVDGGCHFGNKLTVITPSEISENCINNVESVHSQANAWKEDDGNHNHTIANESNNRANNYDLQDGTSVSPNYNELDESCGAAYVTVLALGKNLENGNNTTRSTSSSAGERKSIVNIFNEDEEEEFLPYDAYNENDELLLEECGLAEPIRVLRRQRSIVSIEEKAPEIVEQITVYRLPGERLGFGLRFEGGVTNPSENVRRLFIQSCAEDSPAWRTRTSWDSLVEGDEILEIERVPVSSMTRMDCVQSLKDSSVAVNLLVRHFYSSAEIQLITKAKLQGIAAGDNQKQAVSNPSTPEPFLNDVQEEEIQVFEEERVKKKSRRRIPSSSHSLSAESAYGTGSFYTNPDQRLSSSMSELSANSNSISSDENYYQESQPNYEDEENDLCITKHKLLLEIDNNEDEINYYNSQMPIVPPRRLISNCGTNIIEGNYRTPGSPDDLDLRLKPPAGFDDSLDWELNNNGLIFPDSVLDIMNMSDLLLEAERIRFAINNESVDLFSTEDIDGDGTASTRSTVISRLSMASSAATGAVAYSTFSSPVSNALDNYNTTQQQKSGPNTNANVNVGPQAKLRSGLEETMRNNKSLIPLEPPLSFQDEGEGEDAPFQMPVTNVNIIHSNLGQTQMHEIYEEEYFGEAETDLARCITSNSGSDDMWNPYPNPDDDELALFAQELGQDDDNGSCRGLDELVEMIDGNINLNRFQDTEVMIRIEWLQEIEEHIQTLETEVFPIARVVNREKRIEIENRTTINNEEAEDIVEENSHYLNVNGEDDEEGTRRTKDNRNSKVHFEQNESKLKLDNGESLNMNKKEYTESELQSRNENEGVIEPIRRSKRPKVTSPSPSPMLLNEECELNQRRVEHQFENIEAQFTEQLYSQESSTNSSTIQPSRSSSRNSLSFSTDEKVKVIEVHVKKDTLSTSALNQSSCPTPSPLIENTLNKNRNVIPEQIQNNNNIMTEMTRKETPGSPPIVSRRNKNKIKKGGHSPQCRRRDTAEVVVAVPDDSIGFAVKSYANAEDMGTNVPTGGGLDDQVEQKQRMMNQILLMRPRPVATIQQVDKSPTVMPLISKTTIVMLPDTATTTTTAGTECNWKDSQNPNYKNITSTAINKCENKLDFEGKETGADYSFEDGAEAAAAGRRRQVHEDKNLLQEKIQKSNEKLVRRNSFSSLEDFDGAGTEIQGGTISTTARNKKSLSKSLSLTPRNNVDFPGGNLTGAIAAITHLTYGTNSVLLIGTQSQGSSAEGAEVALEVSEDNSSLDPRTPGMDSSSEVYNPFIPPTFSRLPPDGDEFPSSWSDEKINTHGNDKYNMYDGNHHMSNNNPANKLYRSELNLHNMTVFGNPPPPPIPISEPPSDDFDGCPPPLPASVPPPPSRVLTRRSSVEDRKRLFEAPGYSPKMGHVSRAQEPSKRSVKDKIAMFSTGSSSKEDVPDSNLPTLFQSNNINKSTSLPRVPDNSSRLSKSSVSLLGGIGGMSIPAKEMGNKPEVYSWKMTTAPPPVPKKHSIKDDSVQLRNAGKYTNGDNTSTTNLSERSQSMIDVGGEPGNFHQMYKYNTPARNSMGPTNNASSMMENRRKCMSKLRGLVIPDKMEGVNGSMSVVDLPTIISKDAPLISHSDNLAKVPKQYTMPARQLVSRTESLDGMSSSDDTSAKTQRFGNIITTAAPAEMSTIQSDFSDWKLPNALPKYSPAFKRRSLTPYQTAITSPTMKPRVSANFKMSMTTTPEPKSLESLTSPRSDSSFEYISQSPLNNEPRIVAVTTISSISKRNSTENGKPTVTMNEVSMQRQNSNGPQISTDSSKKSGTEKGKLEDSDNDSAVSSSRSSISHELSPPNSPTPGESSSTPDPDVCVQRKNSETQQNIEINNADQDSANNSDEGWRILKPQSVEAINRKNVLASSKFSSGIVERCDDGSSSSGKNRRSDDEEASYADAETEDTESSCSELEVSKSRRRPTHHNHIHGHGHVPRRSSNATNDTEEDEEVERQTSPPPHSNSKQSAVDFGDITNLPGLTETPLQAIFDMEAKMAYINEICDSLPPENPSRYFSRRDSEQTVIERPIERKLSATSDQVDSASDRRARNRSSSGNESDFSSSISVASQGQCQQTSESNRWSTSLSSGPTSSNLEKKYSKSLTSVNMLSNKQSETKAATPALLVPNPKNPHVLTSGIVEKKIEKIIEKTSTPEVGMKKTTGTAIPRGRNDFKSLSQKWQQISNTEQGKPAAVSTPVKPIPVFEPVAQPTQTRRSLGTSASSAAASEPDAAWAASRRAGISRNSTGTTAVIDPPILSAINATKRSVSVNDIRRAFEKAELAVSYGRDDNSDMMADKSKDSSAILSPPSAHFRVSSFDSTTSEESSATTPAGIYGSVNSLISSVPRDPYGSITSLASSTSLISAQELQQLIDDANQSLEEAGTPSHEVSVVILHREFTGGSLGITLGGGADYETKEITVHKVLTGSIADRDGRIHRGDRVLSITGKSTKGLTHREALNLLKAPRTEVVLVVSRGRSASNGFETIEETSATLDRAVEPLLNGSLTSLLENDEDTNYRWGPTKTVILCKDGGSLGFSLEGGKGSVSGDMPLTVKKIFAGGQAEKSEQLKVGDLITSINNINMSSKSRTEAWNFMKKLVDGEVKIVVRSPV